MDALQYVKFSRPMSPAAERALKRSEVQTDYRFADEAVGLERLKYKHETQEQNLMR